MNQTTGQVPPEEASVAMQDPTEALIHVLSDAKLRIDQQERELEVYRAQLGVLGLVRDLISPRTGGYENKASVQTSMNDISWMIQHHIDQARERLERQAKEEYVKKMAAAATAVAQAPAPAPHPSNYPPRAGGPIKRVPEGRAHPVFPDVQQDEGEI